MEDNWKIVHETDKEYKAVIIREKLAEEGIQSSQIDRKGSEINLFIGTIEIYVHENDVEKAKEIITKHNEL